MFQSPELFNIVSWSRNRTPDKEFLTPPHVLTPPQMSSTPKLQYEDNDEDLIYVDSENQNSNSVIYVDSDGDDDQVVMTLNDPPKKKC